MKKILIISLCTLAVAIRAENAAPIVTNVLTTNWIKMKEMPVRCTNAACTRLHSPQRIAIGYLATNTVAQVHGPKGIVTSKIVSSEPVLIKGQKQFVTKPAN